MNKLEQGIRSVMLKKQRDMQKKIEMEEDEETSVPELSPQMKRYNMIKRKLNGQLNKKYTFDFDEKRINRQETYLRNKELQKDQRSLFLKNVESKKKGSPLKVMDTVNEIEMINLSHMDYTNLESH